MENIVVSFCIPSYNRAEMTMLMVESILKHRGNDIEVVVVDNCSTDDTVQMLEQIKDDRLRIIVNDKNLGGPGNMIESLRFSKGKYSFVAFSREKLRGERICELIEFLNGDEYSLVYCGQDVVDGETEIYKSGAESVKKFGYRWLHPTGFVFNTAMLNEILAKINSTEAEKRFLYFPHDFLATELALMGKTAFWGKNIRIRVEEKYLKKTISANVRKNDDVWFFPKGRVKQYDVFMAHLKELNISDSFKENICFWRYRSLLVYSTLEYRNMRANPVTCDHYSTSTKKISFAEILGIARKIRKSVFDIAKKYDIPIKKKHVITMCLAEEEVMARLLVRKIKQFVLKGRKK